MKKIWDIKNKRWLVILSINLTYGEVYRIEAREEVENYQIFKHGWIEIEGEDLNQIAFDIQIDHNKEQISK